MTDEQTAVVDVDDQEQEQELNQAEDLAKQREAEHYAEIKELNRKFVIAHQQWEILRDQVSGAKKYCDELGKRLSNLIAQGPDYQMKLEFDGKSVDGQVVEQDDQAEPQENNAWKDVPIVDALGLTAVQLDKLEDEGVRTMGQLEEFRAGPGLHSIKGFGPAAVTKIEDQILDWLDQNRDKFGEVVEEAEEQDDQAEEDDDSDTDEDEEDDEAEEDDEDDADELLEDM
jgi:hypothetical protein